MDRVKFFSPNDWSCGLNLRRSQAVISEYEAGKIAQDINEIIELYNIIKFFDNKVFLSSWTTDDIHRYQKTVNTFMKSIARFVRSINNENIIEQYSIVDDYYKSDFWELFDKFKVYEWINEDKFRELLNTSSVSLYDLLRYRNLTEYYGKAIREYMLNNYTSAELLLDKFEIKHLDEKDEIFLPKELSNPDKELIINRYIDSEYPNLNYLRLIANIQSNKDRIVIAPKTLLKAKRKAEELEKKFFTENSGIELVTSVVFSKLQSEPIQIKRNKFSLTISYSEKWIEDNLDFPTLLNNFIYLFQFVDSQMRFTLVSKTNEMGVFERYLLTNSKYAYPKGIAFEQKNTLSLLQMESYYSLIFRFGIRIEEIIEWFFHCYLNEEFGFGKFRVAMPSEQSTYLEKCSNVMPAMESILKQFTLYVEERDIDFELLDIRSEHLVYKNIPSLINRKYAYGVGEEFSNVTFFLFSDQSSLGYINSAKKQKNLFELLRREKIKLDEFPDYSIPRIKWLLEKDYLSIDAEGNLIFSDELLISILYDLYLNEVISYWKYPVHGRKIIDLLERKNVVEFDSSLFSRPEQDYINYTLNKSQFNNGLDLRNLYSHTQPKIGDDEWIHKRNYMIFLRLFILVVIKINDEFCTFFENEDESSY